jgi:hypothetical protein
MLHGSIFLYSYVYLCATQKEEKKVEEVEKKEKKENEKKEEKKEKKEEKKKKEKGEGGGGGGEEGKVAYFLYCQPTQERCAPIWSNFTKRVGATLG